MTPAELSRTKRSKVKFRRRLLAWYDDNKRNLPWRNGRDPYRIWLSEIMLQQTRVAAVLDYYQRFLSRFPTVERLARGRESSVLAAWSGLGYYRRARMLHAAARVITRERGGKFPATAMELRALPGIGRYTAAAIASIAFNEAAAVVDGNVERVLQRLADGPLRSEETWQTAQDLLDVRRPGDFNQAMMELGATICLPRNPLCTSCPVIAFCATRGDRKATPEAARQNKREIGYALKVRNNSVLLVRRPLKASLMPGMWELPEALLAESASDILTLRHSITVTDYTVRVKTGMPSASQPGTWVPRRKLDSLPLTGLARKILRAAQVI